MGTACGVERRSVGAGDAAGLLETSPPRLRFGAREGLCHATTPYVLTGRCDTEHPRPRSWCLDWPLGWDAPPVACGQVHHPVGAGQTGHFCQS